MDADVNEAGGKAGPHRVQLSRRRGWRMPENTVRVCRPGRWGNPWRVGMRVEWMSGPDAGRAAKLDRWAAVELFRRCCEARSLAGERLRAQIREELGGRNLACWCRLDEECHADVLLDVANRRER